MLVLCSPLVFKTFFRKDIRAFAFWPFVIIRDKYLVKDRILINHERIHLKQQVELLILPFYVLYFGEFIIHFIRFKNWNQAYRAISFEKEAYQNHSNSNYTNGRKSYAMWR